MVDYCRLGWRWSKLAGGFVSAGLLGAAAPPPLPPPKLNPPAAGALEASVAVAVFVVVAVDTAAGVVVPPKLTKSRGRSSGTRCRSSGR